MALILDIVEEGEAPDMLAAVKADRGISHSNDDTRLQRYILAAIDFIERETGMSFISTTFDGVDWCFQRRMYIPRPPLLEIVSVKYYDSDNVLQTVDPSKYTVIKSKFEEAQLYFFEMPPRGFKRPDGIIIRFTTDNSTYPAVFPRLVEAISGAWNENREGQFKDIQAIDRCIGQLKTGRYV